MRPSSTSSRIEAAELEDAGRVEAVDRLVEDEQLRVAQQAARDAEALAHAERVGLDLVVGAARRGRRARARRRSRAVRRPVARRGVDVQVLAPGQVRVEARLLDDRADAGERRGALAGQRRGRAARMLPAVGSREAEQQPDQRRLAGAVGAQEPEGDAARAPSRSTPSSAARVPNDLPRPRVSIGQAGRGVQGGEVMAGMVLGARPAHMGRGGGTGDRRRDEPRRRLIRRDERGAAGGGGRSGGWRAPAPSRWRCQEARLIGRELLAVGGLVGLEVPDGVAQQLAARRALGGRNRRPGRRRVVAVSHAHQQRGRDPVGPHTRAVGNLDKKF